MSVGTNLLVQVFEVFAKNKSKEKISRRLYCESGQAAIKSYRFVNDSTREILDQIIPKCKEYKHDKLRTITLVLTFEELTKLKEPELLKEMYVNVGGPSREAYLVCNQKTQSAIQRLGLQEIYVKGKSLKTKN